MKQKYKLVGSAKHTPGPWRVTTTSNKGNGSDWRDIIGTSNFGDIYVAEALKQDAALIAAAPELLEALLLLWSDITKCNGNMTLAEFRELTTVKQRIINAESAIAKAKGV